MLNPSLYYYFRRNSTGLPITLQLLRCRFPRHLPASADKNPDAISISVVTSAVIRDALPGTGPLSLIFIDLSLPTRSLSCWACFIIRASHYLSRGLPLIRISISRNSLACRSDCLARDEFVSSGLYYTQTRRPVKGFDQLSDKLISPCPAAHTKGSFVMTWGTHSKQAGLYRPVLVIVLWLFQTFSESNHPIFSNQIIVSWKPSHLNFKKHIPFAPAQSLNRRIRFPFSLGSGLAFYDKHAANIFTFIIIYLNFLDRIWWEQPPMLYPRLEAVDAPFTWVIESSPPSRAYVMCIKFWLGLAEALAKANPSGTEGSSRTSKS